MSTTTVDLRDVEEAGINLRAARDLLERRHDELRAAVQYAIRRGASVTDVAVAAGLTHQRVSQINRGR